VAFCALAGLIALALLEDSESATGSGSAPPAAAAEDGHRSNGRDASSGVELQQQPRSPQLTGRKRLASSAAAEIDSSDDAAPAPHVSERQRLLVVEPADSEPSARSRDDDDSHERQSKPAWPHSAAVSLVPWTFAVFVRRLLSLLIVGGATSWALQEAYPFGVVACATMAVCAFVRSVVARLLMRGGLFAQAVCVALLSEAVSWRALRRLRFVPQRSTRVF
jgi:hypothetical protein